MEVARLSQKKKVLFSILATLIACFVLFAGLEIGLRLYYGNIARITGVNEWTTAEWKGIAYHWDVYHPRFGWTNRPNYRSRPGDLKRVTINSQGLREMRDFAVSPPEGKRRIIVFGDSFTFGDEVHDEETIPALMAERLERTEVLNFGVHGYGLGQMALRLEEEGFALNPTHVCVIYPTQDYVRDMAAVLTHTKPVFGIENGELAISNIPVPEQSRLPWIYRSSFAIAKISGPTLQPRWDFPLKQNLAVFEKIIERIKNACEKHNVPLTIVHITEPSTVAARAAGDYRTLSVVHQITKVLDQPHLDLLNLVSFLDEQHAEQGKKLVAPGGHWSAAANRLIADQIVQHLKESE